MDAKNFLRSIEREAIVAYTNKQGVIEYVNANFCKISGYSKSELIGQDHRIINSGFHSKEFIKEIWSTILSGNVWVGDICNRAKDGSLYWVNTTLSPSIVDGEIVGFYAVRHDITRQKELEEKNRELTRLSNEIQQMAHIGRWSYELKNKKFTISAQLRSILEIPQDLEVSPQDIDELISSENKFSELFELTLSQEMTLYDVFKMISLKGEIKWVKANASLIKNKKGQVQKIAGVFYDITDLKVAEENTEIEKRKSVHAAKLASIGEMTSSIVHEMNNPITVIQGLIRTALKFEDLDKVHERLKKMEAPVEHLKRLAKNLRQYSRGQKPVSNKRNYQLDQLVDESMALIQHRLKYTAVDCAIELEKNLEITCDSEQIKQVIINLFNNSIDVIEHLRSRWIKIEGVKKDNKVILSFVDSGEGIPKKIRDQIFDPFFTTKDPQKGTGLGLGIVRDILSQHGATIEIDGDDPNTKFIMTFPVK